jgi:hypothetical protein
MWVLIEKYKIPCFFLSNKYLLETNYNKNILLGYGERNDKFAFILVPGFRVETIPSYKIIISKEEDIFISLENIKNEECLNVLQQAFDNTFTIENYLQNFVKASKTNYQKKKPKTTLITKLIIEEDPVQEKLNEDDIVIIQKKTKKRMNSEKNIEKKVSEKNTTRKNK